MDIIKNLLEKYVNEWNEKPTNATVPYSQVITDLDHALQLLQPAVISRSYTRQEVRELFNKLEQERSRFYPEDANSIVPLEEWLLENGL